MCKHYFKQLNSMMAPSTLEILGKVSLTLLWHGYFKPQSKDCKFGDLHALAMVNELSKNSLGVSVDYVKIFLSQTCKIEC